MISNRLTPENDPAPSTSRGEPQNGVADHIDTSANDAFRDVQEKLSEGLQQVTGMVSKKPGIAVGVALLAGVAIGWWVKRR